MSNEVAKITFDTRLGCDNCGHTQIKTLPIRSTITDFSNDDDIKSCYQEPDAHFEKTLRCDYCLLPRLQVFWWKEEESIVRVKDAS